MKYDYPLYKKRTNKKIFLASMDDKDDEGEKANLCFMVMYDNEVNLNFDFCDDLDYEPNLENEVKNELQNAFDDLLETYELVYEKYKT